MNNKRIVWIDVLRGICVLYIVGIWHLDDYMFIKYENDFTYQTTYCILAAFMFISGYLASKNFIYKIKDVLFYYRKKLLRIYPLYILAVILMIFVGYFKLELLPVYITGVGGVIIYPYPSTLWFVCMLFVFYIISPFLINKKIEGKSFFLFIFFQIFFFLLHVLGGADIRLTYYWPFYYWGIVSGQWDKRLVKKNIGSIMLWFGVYLALSTNLGREFSIYTYICAFSFIYSIGNFLNKIFTTKNQLIEFISYSSFCAYLFHRVIFAYIQELVGMFTVVEAYFIYLPIVFVISYFIQYIYDLLLGFMKKRVKTYIGE